jgi:methionyl-tRNA formyltransferase
VRTVLIAHPSLGAKLLGAILKRGGEVVAVFIPGGDASKPSPLKTLAQDNGIPVYEPARMKEAGVHEAMARYSPELGVFAFVQDIVPVAILNCPRKGTIMYHPSLLPEHRGGSAMNWAIIQGETRTGLSVIWPDAGIDSGPMLLQKEVDILPDDTVASLFFDRLYPMGIAALTEAIQLVREGKGPRIPQDESRATYEPLCQEQHGIINWAKPAREVYNLIRGTNPRPGASATCKGGRLKIFNSGLVGSAPEAAPGEVILVGDDGFSVACQDGSILVRQVQPQGSAKVGATEFARDVNLRRGDRLG